MPPDRRGSTASASVRPSPSPLAAFVPALDDRINNHSGHSHSHSLASASQHPQSSASPPADSGTDGRKPTKGIGRGRACLTCRKRKVKCDGVQPQCGVCLATAVRLGQDPTLVVCDFPSEEERRKPVGGGKVYALEAKIQSLERKLADAEARAAALQQQQQQQQAFGTPSSGPHAPAHNQLFPYSDPSNLNRPLSPPRPRTASSIAVGAGPGSRAGRTPRSRHASTGEAHRFSHEIDPLGPRYLDGIDTALAGSGSGQPDMKPAASLSLPGPAAAAPISTSAYPGFALASAAKSGQSETGSPFMHHPPMSVGGPSSLDPTGNGSPFPHSHAGLFAQHPAVAVSNYISASPTYALMGPSPDTMTAGPARPAPFSDPPPVLTPPLQMHLHPTTTTNAEAVPMAGVSSTNASAAIAAAVTLGGGASGNTYHPTDSGPVPSVVPSGPRLPSYATLSRLVNIFFDYPHEAVDLINRRRFMTAFDHPPDHPDYPAECLLHAMVATATDLSGLEAWEGEERYWNEGQSPAVFHADLAEYLLPLGFRTERNLLQVAQAAVLFACLNLYHGRFSRAYVDTSIAVRICTSLGLNHNVFLPNHLPLSSFLAHRTALPPPSDEEEARERSVTWWFAYTVETFSAAATGWACCIDERDITTLVPAAGPVGDDPMTREALYLHSPSFFVTNPPHLVRLVQINLKVTVLLNRVCTFVSRTTALANATPERSALRPSEFPKIRSSPAFTKLEAALENFGRKAPAQLVALLEPEAFLCPSLVATSVIILHERFCTSEHNDPSMIKCLEAANSILQNMQVLNNASFHPRQIPPFLSFCWTVAARTYLRQLAIRKLKGMPPLFPDGVNGGGSSAGGGSGPTLEDEVRHLTQIVKSIIARLEHFRTPVGPLMAASLVSLLDRPDICLPESDRILVDRSGQTAIANLTSVMSTVAPAAVNV